MQRMSRLIQQHSSSECVYTGVTGSQCGVYFFCIKNTHTCRKANKLYSIHLYSADKNHRCMIRYQWFTINVCVLSLCLLVFTLARLVFFFSFVDIFSCRRYYSKRCWFSDSVWEWLCNSRVFILFWFFIQVIMFAKLKHSKHFDNSNTAY